MEEDPLMPQPRPEVTRWQQWTDKGGQLQDVIWRTNQTW